MSLLKSLGELFVKTDDPTETKELAQWEASKYTVLLVDDNKEFLNTCADFLREAGYNVLKSSTGSKGLNMLRYAPKDISLTLLDYDMPELDGSATLQYLRKMAPEMHVGAISGLDEMMLPASFREQVDQFLAKPFRREQLLQFVHELLKAPRRQSPAVPVPATVIPATAGLRRLPNAA